MTKAFIWAASFFASVWGASYVLGQHSFGWWGAFPTFFSGAAICFFSLTAFIKTLVEADW